jgi:polyisoprenyl-phosphate glycosyltransferase
MKTITFISGTYNEVENVEELLRRVWAAAEPFKDRYSFEYIIIDNNSTDGTQELLRKLAAEDKRLKLIFNMRNFGQIRSGYHVFLQARGDAAIGLASDLQDPPEMIPQYIEKWEEGYKIVLAQKNESEESAFFFAVRKAYYSLIASVSDVRLLKNVTGAGLYDQEVIEQFRKLNDPYPYMRGIISDFGYPVARIPFTQPTRKRGFTKNNFYSLYDYAMLGLTSFSKVPLRLATMFGFALSLLSLLMAIGYFIYKLLYWRSFPVGVAPVVIGIYLFSSVQLFFIGILGEYIGAIHTQVLKRPLVIEKERINF